jgi:hypothetical protein
MKEWYYKGDDERKGPFGESQMKNLFRSGVIKPDTSICTVEWKSADKYTDISSCSSSIPLKKLNPIESKIASISMILGIVSIVALFLPVCWHMVAPLLEGADELMPLMVSRYWLNTIGLIFIILLTIPGSVGLITGIISIILIIKRKSDGIGDSVLGIILSFIGFAIPAAFVFLLWDRYGRYYW